MKIKVDRFVADSDTTVSRVSVDGSFACFDLEDEYRTTKLVNETRIPAGTYRVLLRTARNHHRQYKVQFPDFNRGMLHIQDGAAFGFMDNDR